MEVVARLGLIAFLCYFVGIKEVIIISGVAILATMAGLDWI